MRKTTTCTERLGGIAVAVYSKYLLKMIHRFGFWHADWKAQKRKNEYDFIRCAFSGIVRPCLNL